MFLRQRCTGERLKDIGDQFGIGETAVSPASSLVNDKIRNDKKLKRKIPKIDKSKCVKNEDLLSF